MTDNGKSFPVFKFDQIIDTDIGLLKLIEDKYNDKSTFYWSLVEAPIKFKIGLLYDRKHPNPLTVIAKERDNIELLDDYYQQFMTEEYVYILKKSIVTNIYRAITKFVTVEGITPIIVCNSAMEENYLMKIDKDVFSKCTIIVTKDYGAGIDDKSDIIYFKDVRETIKVIQKIEGKNIYIGSFRFNFEDDERTNLLKDYNLLFKGIIKTRSYDPYDETDIIRGT